jgi:hypothetical protein
MLKRTIISFTIILLVSAVTSGLNTSCATNIPMKVVRDHELRDNQWKEFNAIREYFLRNVFPRCTGQSKLKLSCSGCEYIYIVVRITINAEGKMTDYTKIKENVCGGTAPEGLERCFIEYMESITFPGNLRSMIIETSLGNGLKC